MGRNNILFTAWLIYSLSTAVVVASLVHLGTAPV